MLKDIAVLQSPTAEKRTAMPPVTRRRTVGSVLIISSRLRRARRSLATLTVFDPFRMLVLCAIEFLCTLAARGRRLQFLVEKSRPLVARMTLQFRRQSALSDFRSSCHL